METIQSTANNTPITGDAINITDTDIIIDENFSLEGFQVVRGEFFAHMYEPSITFNNGKVTLNTVCIKKLPFVNYINFLVNQNTMKLVIQPSDEEMKDSFLWCSEKDGKKKPRPITCKVFFAKLVDLMKWNPNYRYKMLGKIIHNGEGYLIVFDLTATETYQRILKEGEKPRTSRTPIFPEEWKNQFGVPVEEHKKLLQVNIFDGYTVFGLESEKKVKSNSEEANTDDNSNPNISSDKSTETTSYPSNGMENALPQQNQQQGYGENNTMGAENIERKYY